MKKFLLFVFLLTFYCTSAESSRRISASGDPDDIFFEKEELIEAEVKKTETKDPVIAQEKKEQPVASSRDMNEDDTIPVESGQLKSEKDFDEIGISSWYGTGFQGNKTASGEIFDKNKLTAAHQSLPIGTIIKVYNFDTQKEISVRINDRGPFSGNRILDVSEKTADILNFKHAGMAKVGIKVVKTGNGAVVPADKIDDESVADDEELELTAAIQEDKGEKIEAIKPEAKIYFIQLGVFKEKSGAEKIKETVSTDFKEAIKIIEKDGNYVVQMGNFKDRKSAESLRDKMKGKGIDCFIPVK